MVQAKHPQPKPLNSISEGGETLYLLLYFLQLIPGILPFYFNQIALPLNLLKMLTLVLNDDFLCIDIVIDREVLLK